MDDEPTSWALDLADKVVGDMTKLGLRDDIVTVYEYQDELKKIIARYLDNARNVSL